MRKLLSAFVLLLCSTTICAQNFWSASVIAATIKKDNHFKPSHDAKEYKLYHLDSKALHNQLFKIVDGAPQHNVIIAIPNADGKMEQFEMTEASNFEPALQASYPGIRSFSGKGITDSTARLRLSISPEGIQTFLQRKGKEQEMMEPYLQDDDTYAVYKPSAVSGESFSCFTKDSDIQGSLQKQSSPANLRAGNYFIKLPLAISVNSLYAQAFNAHNASNADLIWQQVNKVLATVNAIFERDLGIRLEAIKESEKVFFYKTTDDPYAEIASSGELLQTAGREISTRLKNNKYSIAHLLCVTNLADNILGLANIGTVCTNSGGGFTSYPIRTSGKILPKGYGFNITMAHEIGHQLGANHTFSYIKDLMPVEPASGVTIMGYAGITDQNISGKLSGFFHAKSIEEIESKLSANSCATTVIINRAPIAKAGTKYTIPHSTAFELSGYAATESGQVIEDPRLTYCWEQIDKAGEGEFGLSSAARPGKLQGPNFVSFPPAFSPTRIFPQLKTILDGKFITGPLEGGDDGINAEALSNVARTLNFRFTIRDNVPFNEATTTGPHTAYTDVAVTVSNKGPFMITAPNLGTEAWTEGENVTIRWDVAESNTAPVSCANVKILLSADGGYTFPVTLMESTPNTGTATVKVPAVITSTARIKVQAIGNIFFDICDKDFEIRHTCNTRIIVDVNAVIVQDPNNAAQKNLKILFSPLLSGMVADVEKTDISPEDYKRVASGLTVPYYVFENVSASTLQRYRVRIRCSSQSADDPNVGVWGIRQFTVSNCNVVPWALSSTNITGSSAKAEWTNLRGIASYDVQYKKSDSFDWIDKNVPEDINTASSQYNGASYRFADLDGGTDYDWRVRSVCVGSNAKSEYTEKQHFTTKSCDLDVTELKYELKNTEAILMWKALDNVSYYEVNFKRQDESWENCKYEKDIFSNEFTINKSWFNPGYIYNWRVRAQCINNAYSEWANASFVEVSCDAVPILLSASDVTINSAVLNWAPITGGLHYELQYREKGATNWISGFSARTSLPIDKLKPGTNYQWQIKTLCGGDESGTFSPVQEFTTLGCDLKVKGLTSVINATGAVLNWWKVTDAASYDVEFQEKGKVYNGAKFETNVTKNSATCSNWYFTILPAFTNTCYWRVRARCADKTLGQWTDYAKIIPPACSPPAQEGLTVTAICKTEATFNWVVVPGMTGKYLLWYKEETSKEWTNKELSFSLSSYTATELKSNTTYVWKMESKCDDRIGPDSIEQSFTTK